ncbi:hypothetical protein RFI_16941 [Reticulomyxa filosa]|uniref:Uncharacterized protein n=1 Tax=Reticulomyxa filosa TaxID=46433 RepID=X6N2F8_RETFI|nr:hypothetical protein RFI_16941 [Reticulomyxa filosa]|eukprot:ETO20276.1 hypothetical protein RFI_16941 [Reticulomyxa filosa]
MDNNTKKTSYTKFKEFATKIKEWKGQIVMDEAEKDKDVLLALTKLQAYQEQTSKLMECSQKWIEAMKLSSKCEQDLIRQVQETHKILAMFDNLQKNMNTPNETRNDVPIRKEANINKIPEVVNEKKNEINSEFYDPKQPRRDSIARSNLVVITDSNSQSFENHETDDQSQSIIELNKHEIDLANTNKYSLENTVVLHEDNSDDELTHLPKSITIFCDQIGKILQQQSIAKYQEIDSAEKNWLRPLHNLLHNELVHAWEIRQIYLKYKKHFGERNDQIGPTKSTGEETNMPETQKTVMKAQANPSNHQTIAKVSRLKDKLLKHLDNNDKQFVTLRKSKQMLIEAVNIIGSKLNEEILIYFLSFKDTIVSNMPTLSRISN